MAAFVYDDNPNRICQFFYAPLSGWNQLFKTQPYYINLYCLQLAVCILRF